jgi:hypothetical protein
MNDFIDWENVLAMKGTNTGSGRTFGVLNQNSRERSEFWFR